MSAPQPSFSLLFVHHLPTHRDAKAVANRLQRLSTNCGGKVLGVSGGSAVLRFSSAEAAERARKRMENEDVLGHRIVLSFSPDGPEEEEERCPPAASAVFLPVEKPRSPRRLRASRSCHGRSPYSHASSCSPVMRPLPQVSCVPASSPSSSNRTLALLIVLLLALLACRRPLLRLHLPLSSSVSRHTPVSRLIGNRPCAGVC